MSFLGKITGRITNGAHKGKEYECEIAESGSDTTLYIDGELIPISQLHAHFHYLKPNWMVFSCDEEVMSSIEHVNLDMSGIVFEASAFRQKLEYKGEPMLGVEEIDLYSGKEGTYALIKLELKKL